MGNGMSDRDTVVDMPTPARGRPSAGGGGSGGNGFDERLRRVEQQLARIETELRHTATRAWVLGGVVGGMAIAAVITIGLLKLFEP